jgi:hypothetical protein
MRPHLDVPITAMEIEFAIHMGRQHISGPPCRSAGVIYLWLIHQN